MVTASEVASADRAGGVSITTVPGSPALPGGEYVVKALGPSRVTVTFRSSWPAGPGVSMYTVPGSPDDPGGWYLV